MTDPKGAGSPGEAGSPLEQSDRTSRLSPAKQALLNSRLRAGFQSNAPSQTISRRPSNDPTPLSFAQERLWFLSLLEPESPAYNRFACYRITGRLDVDALERSFHEIVRRHEILRASFPAQNGHPVQAIIPTLSPKLEIRDFSQWPEDTRQAEAVNVARAEAHRPFDLSRGPLFRTTLLRLQDTEHWLMVTAHHIVFDGWSESVMLDELAKLYAGFSAGQTTPLPDLPIQYGDFAYWQRERLTREAQEPHIEYWRQRLSGSPPLLQLPADHPRPGIRTARGGRQSIVLPVPLSEALRHFSRSMATTLFMLLVSAFKVLLYRTTGQEDISVGFPVAGRTHSETEPLIGLFVNTLVLRSRLSGKTSFQDLVTMVRETVLEDFEHQEVPFETLVREMKPERSLSFSPLFQVFFNFRNLKRPPALAEGLQLEKIGLDTGISQFDLTLEITEEAGGLSCTAVYNADLFESATIIRMLDYYETLLQGVVRNPEHIISLMPLIPEAACHQLLVEWNDTRAAYPDDACIHQLFEKEVRSHPQSIAASCAGEECTYEELNQRANRLAHYLRKRNVKPGVIVGLLLDRSFDLLAGTLAVLKAGGACLQLDPDYPDARIVLMLQEANAQLILTQSIWLESVSACAAERLCLDTDEEILRLEPDSNLEIRSDPGQLAYVFFTSGSTGSPKGVLTSHRGVVNCLAFMAEAYGIGSEDVVLQLASPSFDASIRDTIGPLTAGARVVLLKNSQARDPATIIETIGSQRVTCLVSIVPSLLRTLSGMVSRQPYPSLRLILATGENLYASVCRRAREAFGPHFRLINQYGPTETTMFCCYYPVDVLPETEGVVPIGKPIPNCRFYVLDRHLNPVPIGVPGELYIGGVGVARGYLNNLEMTDRSFIRDPWNEDSDARIYKSGDLVRYRPDGNLEILGRLDQQVKIRGCRVEMEEVEAVMRRHPQVQEAVVIASGDDPGALRLAAYFVPKPDFRPTPEEWRRHMSASLPGFMVPSFFTPLAALPITPNGKVDRKALPPPGATPREEAAPPSGQRNPVESDLVRIWEDELGIRPVGVRDNFFDLGGHSLLAASLFARIEKVFGRRLPLATLFSAPTIELLAQRLQDAQPTSGSSLVAIRSQGDGYPVFWVHTLGGHILLYERLARYLASNRPIYALKPVGIDDGRPPHARIEDMAAHYLSEIRAVQPAGPYWLGGQSFGGLAAFEMACQLQKRGEKVAGLLILDTYAPGCDCSTSVLRRRALRLSRWLDFHRVNLRMMTARQKPAYLLERLTLLLVNIGVYPSKNLKGIINIYRAHARARHAYSPQVYPGRITLFRASRQPLAGTADPQSGWGKLAAQGVEVHEVPGSHSSIIVEPHVRTLAAKLQTCLEDSGLPG
jgi:amino acid adenylation domain-containing protein